ncbi:hypothetical protein Vadar_000854 [Vaccinium darrowii]|uniref:Uncharacterized protein n=1 Tax=Vaccinium darrowii TaxID=229202 RepID=A0ACB7Y5E8_9ERIC|nr:hypothetical protein Vadar_000854 [Vaccinium darrowii]
MSFCSSMAFLLVRFKFVEPMAFLLVRFKFVEPVSMSNALYLKSVVPIGALYALSLCRGLLNQRSVQKGMLQIQDNGEYAISLGVAIAAYGEAKFDVWGVTLQLGAVALEATRLVMIQILLASGVISLNPFNSVYYVAPCCMVFLFVPWVFVEYPLMKEASGFHFDFLIFGSNSLCAFALNLAVFLLVGKTSALTMNIAGVVKEWFLIVFSWYVIKDMLTPVNLVGYAVVFSGVAYYNYSKLQALKAKDVQNKPGQTDEQGPP